VSARRELLEEEREIRVLKRKENLTKKKAIFLIDVRCT